ncbi:MAG: hypothetical protein SVM80_10695 [Halobacteriota archaeon]|nr:hypothetical protein [Halobacteriota archaeon]
MSESRALGGISGMMGGLLDRVRRGEVNLAPLLKRFMGPELIEGLGVAMVDELRNILNSRVKEILAEDIDVLTGRKFYLGFLDVDSPPIEVEIIGLPNLIGAKYSTREEVKEQGLPGIELESIAIVDLMGDMQGGGGLDLTRMITLIEEDKMKFVKMGELLQLFVPMASMMSPTSFDTLEKRLMPGLMGRLPGMMMGSGIIEDIGEPDVMQSMMPIMMPMLMPMMGGLLASFITPKLDDPEFRSFFGKWVEKGDKKVLLKTDGSGVTIRFRKNPDLGVDIEEGICSDPDVILETIISQGTPKLTNLSTRSMVRDVVTRKITRRSFHDLMIFGKLILPEMNISYDGRSTNIEMDIVM